MKRSTNSSRTLFVIVDGKRKVTTAGRLAAEHDLDAKARAKIGALQPGERVKLKGDDGAAYVIERPGAHHGRRHVLHGKKIRRGARRRRHRFATPAAHGGAIADLDAAYRHAKRQYKTLGRELWAAKTAE
jgi:hypothetical protein